MRENRTSGSMSGSEKPSHGRASEALPEETGSQRIGPAYHYGARARLYPIGVTPTGAQVLLSGAGVPLDTVLFPVIIPTEPAPETGARNSTPRASAAYPTSKPSSRRRPVPRTGVLNPRGCPDQGLARGFFSFRRNQKTGVPHAGSPSDPFLPTRSKTTRKRLHLPAKECERLH